MRGAATDSYLSIAADHRVDKGRLDMILATTKVEDYERFLAIFSTKGAEKRRQHVGRPQVAELGGTYDA